MLSPETNLPTTNAKTEIFFNSKFKIESISHNDFVISFRITELIKATFNRKLVKKKKRSSSGTKHKRDFCTFNHKDPRLVFLLIKTVYVFGFFFIFLFTSFLLTINLKLIIVHVEIKIVNKEAATKRSTLLHDAIFHNFHLKFFVYPFLKQGCKKKIFKIAFNSKCFI